MARTKLSDELKKAIANLPEREKDKLLFRLIPSNAKLVDRLIFDLLEGGNTKEDRREELEDEIRESLENAAKTYYSPGYLLLDIRDLSGELLAMFKRQKTSMETYR